MNKFGEFLKKIGLFFEHLIFPDDIKCIFCGKDVPDFEHKPYCDECEKIAPFNNKNKCIICDEPIENEAIVCDYCQKHKRQFKKAFCPFVYDGVARKLILRYKSSNQRYLAKAMAKFIVEEIKNSGVKIDVVTFVPMTKKKQRERSFNQSERLASEIAKLLDLPVEPFFLRVKDNVAQKLLSAKEREKAVEELYALNVERLKVRPFKKDENVLIVDDVITTGSTVNALSKLIAKRVKTVYVCAFARNLLLKDLENKLPEEQLPAEQKN